MKTYHYKAMDVVGRLRYGNIDAFNLPDLEARINKMGFDLIRHKELQRQKRFIRKIERRELINFCFHLEQTSKAGIPILQSLKDLRDSTETPRLHEVVASMIEAIEGGKTLAEAMRLYPSVFSEVFTSLVSAGEQSGTISQVFFQLAESIKWQDEQIAMTKKLLSYPLFVGIVVIGVIFFLMLYLVPQLLSFIINMGQEVPLHTKILVLVSNIFVNYWYLVLGIPIATALGVYIAIIVDPDGLGYQVDRLKLEIPIAGPIFKKIILARLASFFAMMYGAGITIIDCLHASQNVVGNKAVKAAIKQVEEQVIDGSTLSDSFASIKLFPPLVLRMIQVGETTGALEDALANVHYFYTRDAKESIEKLQTMVGPSMTIILGLMILWVIFSVLGPIYDLITKIKI